MDCFQIHVSVFFMKGPGHEERYSTLAYALVSPHRYLSVPPGIYRGCHCRYGSHQKPVHAGDSNTAGRS
jgi:hypothetical protein